MPDEFDLDKELANHGRKQAKQQTCPHCGSKNAVVLIFGRTTLEIAAKLNVLYDGEWAAAGPFPDNGENFYCKECGHSFEGHPEPFPGLFG